mgnify:CR=1 FL=1
MEPDELPNYPEQRRYFDRQIRAHGFVNDKQKMVGDICLMDTSNQKPQGDHLD